MSAVSDDDTVSGKVDAVRVGGGGACPICGQVVVPRFRPFCSRRCADGDLYRWLKGDYRIPTDERPEDGTEVAMSGQDEDDEKL